MQNQVANTSQGSLMGNIAFLMLSFPMGLIYFVLTITGLSVGLGTLVIWVGLFISFATLFMVHGMAEIERRLVSSLLRMPQAYQPYRQRETSKGFLRRFGNVLRDPYTWTSTIYMLFIKMPLGIINFTLTLTFLVLSAALTFMPLFYLLNLFIDSILAMSGVAAHTSILVPYFIEIHGSFDPLIFVRTFACIPLGLVIWLITRLLITGLARLSGELANAMLGPGTSYAPAQPHMTNYAPPLRVQEQQVYSD